MSASGQYISAVTYFLSSSGGYIYVSSNYGASFTFINTQTSPLPTINDNFLYISMSASGQYQTAVSNTTGGGGGSFGSGLLYISIDYGNTWNIKTQVSPSFSGSAWSSVCISYTGQYQLASSSSTLYISSDYGNTWTISQTLASSGYTYSAISASGQYLSVATSGVNIQSSNIYIPSAKSFIIDHPLDYSKYLVHACLEGPEAGVYYRGRGEITNDICVEINLPDYVCAFARDFTIKVTGIYDGTPAKIYSAGEVINNRFMIYGGNGCFYWTVTGSRGNILVEPDKNAVIVKGDGPYKWYEQ
jgi:hypothetical protein